MTVSDGRYVMGTVLEITLVARDAERGRRVLEELFAKVAELESIYSTWQPDSEVSKLNRQAGGAGLKVDAELARLLSLSKDYASLTGGSFDVTVGPLVALWRQAGESGRLPEEAALQRARSRVGSQAIRIEGRRVALDAGFEVNLSGVAKGHALDLLRPLLERHGIEGALLSFGQSSTWAVGRPADAPGWRLLALGPDEDLLGLVTLEDRALSVSGSLGQWVEIEGRRYGHVIDPRSGRALTRRRQALVVAGSGSLAEALSKALLVLGEREALALVEAQTGCEAMLADADGRTWRTSGWNEAVRFEEVGVAVVEDDAPRARPAP